MRKKMLPLFAPTLLLLAAMLAGCNKDETDANQLPDGKHPLTLTATMEGLTATRATVDGAWALDDKVAISINGGTTSQSYKISDATSGKLTPAEADKQLYWTSQDLQVSAWHAANYSATKPTTFSVAADQNAAAKYQSSDMLYAYQQITFDASTSPSLEFKHLPAKVVVNLKKGEGVTESEVQNATVTLVSQNLTSGTIGANWTVTAVAAATTDNSEIKTNVLTTPTDGFQKTVQALVVPQQMQNKQFIKVTIGTGTAARDYSYTTATNDANLESGTQYTYAITVKKNELVVSVAGTSSGWTDSPLGAGTAETSTSFRVTMPSANIPVVTITGATKKTGEAYYEVDKGATTVTISYPFSDKGFPVVQGLCNVKRAVSDDTYTFTCSNIRSDLKLAYDIYCQLGDFYCKDANGNAYFIPGDATPTDAQKTACLGIVYWVGDITGDNYGLLNRQFPGGTHGLVACKQVLTDPDEAKQPMQWVNGGSSVSAWLATATWTGPDRPTNFTSIQHEQRMQGYANTVALKEYNKAIEVESPTSSEIVIPIVALDNFAGIASNSAPTSSSGWYWPSVTELKMMCWGQGNTWNAAGRDMLNNQFSKVNGSDQFTGSSWSYWSSTERSTDPAYAWYVNFENFSVNNIRKSALSCSVRPVLAF